MELPKKMLKELMDEISADAKGIVIEKDNRGNISEKIMEEVMNVDEKFSADVNNPKFDVTTEDYVNTTNFNIENPDFDIEDNIL